MDCKSCRNDLDKYIGGILSDATRSEVEDHLRECSSCSSHLAQIILADKVIDFEKNEESNPFLSTRIMAAIDNLESNAQLSRHPSFAVRFLKPALITVTITAAVFLGIVAGNIGRNKTISSGVPEEIVYLNDSDLESLNLYITE